jgi:hypothetical protein
MKNEIKQPGPGFLRSEGGDTMKAFFFLSAVFVGITGIGTHADAQNYPWCAYYKGGGTNCGFTTFDQCMVNVSGIHGYCARNTQYVPPALGPRPR